MDISDPDHTPADVAAGEGMALYVHWPFCMAKCPYCDFNSHVRNAVDETRWRTALLREIDHLAARLPDRRVDSVFFGGGTPSLMSPDTVGAMLDRLSAHWTLTPGVEITLEANPGASEVGRFQGFRAAGVNRVSIGVQSLDDEALRFLGRIHDASEGRAAVERAASVFPRYSFDLIYARPGQDAAGWTRELDAAVGLADGHLSVYQLTIEPGTAFHTMHRTGDLVLPDEDTLAALYEITQDRLGGAGLPAYEISNHARPGEESRHNLCYWNYRDYAGIGPGAHGRLTIGGGKYATRQVRLPERWLSHVEATGHGLEEESELSPRERGEEMLMMGLRVANGVDAAHFRTETGETLEAFLDGAPLGELVGAGFLASDETGLRATAEGRARLDAVLAALLA